MAIKWNKPFLRVYNTELKAPFWGRVSLKPLISHSPNVTPNAVTLLGGEPPTLPDPQHNYSCWAVIKWDSQRPYRRGPEFNQQSR